MHILLSVSNHNNNNNNQSNKKNTKKNMGLQQQQPLKEKIKSLPQPEQTERRQTKKTNSPSPPPRPRRTRSPNTKLLQEEQRRAKMNNRSPTSSPTTTTSRMTMKPIVVDRSKIKSLSPPPRRGSPKPLSPTTSNSSKNKEIRAQSLSPVRPSLRSPKKVVVVPVDNTQRSNSGKSPVRSRSPLKKTTAGSSHNKNKSPLRSRSPTLMARFQDFQHRGGSRKDDESTTSASWKPSVRKKSLRNRVQMQKVIDQVLVDDVKPRTKSLRTRVQHQHHAADEVTNDAAAEFKPRTKSLRTRVQAQQQQEEHDDDDDSQDNDEHLFLLAAAAAASESSD